jgi:hypothetical protein
VEFLQAIASEGIPVIAAVRRWISLLAQEQMLSAFAH